MLAALAEGENRGLELTENPAVDPVDHAHSGGSLHYQELRPGLGRAVDVYGTRVSWPRIRGGRSAASESPA